MNFRNKSILITGANGQLGSAILNIFKQNKINVIGTDRSIMDITNQKQVYEVINKINPQIIIHCAAYTAVDEAEKDKETCYRVNVEGTRNLALIAKELNILFVYFSTDYVFDGIKKEPYLVSDIPNPINYYGLTKYLGEEIIKTLLVEYYIFRISWVFGPNGKNFVKTIISLASQRPSISVVIDQIGSPTYTIDVANFLLLKNKLKPGIYHLTNEGFTSWYGFATEIINLSQLDCKVYPILSINYKTIAKRGLNSKLHNNTLKLPHWKKSLIVYMKQELFNIL